ncbi:MAG: hypothetical protein K6B17_10365 [Treponema sp.]|nr:hypothetical protein [Treponema sp.]
MKFKKSFYAILFCLFCSISLHADKWIDYGKNILQENPNDQIKYWLEFLEKNLSDQAVENSLGAKVHTLKDCTIIELSTNDSGNASKSGIPSHSYRVQTKDKKSVTISISKDEIEFALGSQNKNLYWINLTKSKTEYRYLDYDDGFSVDVKNGN